MAILSGGKLITAGEPVATSTIQGGSPGDYETIRQELTSIGWVVLSEGSSGMQLKQPKQMALADKVCIAIGVPLLFFWGFGLLLIAIGLIDYALLTKEQTHFLSRTQPMRPSARAIKKSGFRII